MADHAPRRTFLGLLTGGISALVGVAALIPGLRFLAHPLGAPTVSGGEGPIRVAATDEVKAGRPLRVIVYGQRRDGWTRIDRMKLGAAWLTRANDGQVRAFSAVCPHLGCGIDWDEKAETFTCPCHDSGFALDGRCLHGPAPRGLDELEVVATGNEIRVRYQRFKVAIRQREPIG